MEDNKTKIEFTNTFIKLFNYERDNKITLKEFMTEIWEWHISNQVEKPVEPACRHKLTAKQFFIEQYQNGKCEDITTNPEPEFNNAFYLNIYKLMEDYSKLV